MRTTTQTTPVNIRLSIRKRLSPSYYLLKFLGCGQAVTAILYTIFKWAVRFFVYRTIGINNSSFQKGIFSTGVLHQISLAWTILRIMGEQ